MYDPVRSLRVTADAAASLPKFARVHAAQLINGATTATASMKLFDALSPWKLTAAQTHADYDNIGNNGTFSGGTGFVVNDTITLSDTSVITVDAVSAGVVTQFTVTTAGPSGPMPAVALTQSATSGAGASFTLTPGTANLTSVATLIVAEVHSDEVTDGTASLFQTSRFVTFPPFQIKTALSIDMTGTNAVGYVFYTL